MAASPRQPFHGRMISGLFYGNLTACPDAEPAMPDTVLPPVRATSATRPHRPFHRQAMPEPYRNRLEKTCGNQTRNHIRHKRFKRAPQTPQRPHPRQKTFGRMGQPEILCRRNPTGPNPAYRGTAEYRIRIPITRRIRPPHKSTRMRFVTCLPKQIPTKKPASVSNNVTKPMTYRG